MTCQCFNDIMDYLRLNLPGALDGVIDMEIQNVLDEFLSRTNAWTETAPLKVTAGKKLYPISPIAGLVVRLLAVYDENDVQVVAAMPTLDTVSLRDDPGRTAKFKAYFVVKPTPDQGADSVPEWILVNHRLPLQHGVLGRMMSQVAKPYSNERLAIYHMRKFMSLTAQVRAEKSQQYLYRGQVWHYPQNFARGTQR
jgi:hypothetical protein